MKRYFIEEAKCGLTAGGFACGPVPSNIVVTVKFRENDETQWLSSVEVGGIPNYYLADKDFHEDLVKEDFNDEEFTKYLDEHYISEFNGISLGEYPDTFCSFTDDPDNPAIPLVRYLITLVRCPMENVDALITMARGEYADELDLPASDVEAEFTEDFEEEE